MFEGNFGSGLRKKEDLMLLPSAENPQCSHSWFLMKLLLKKRFLVSLWEIIQGHVELAEQGVNLLKGGQYTLKKRPGAEEEQLC